MMDRGSAQMTSERPALRFGREIQKALTAGTGAGDLTLRLTLMDASKIKRDREVAMADVSFSPEGMRYLGVRVVEGGVKSSELFSGPLPEADVPPVVEAAKGQKKSTKEPRKPKAEKPKPVVQAGRDFLTPPAKGKS